MDVTTTLDQTADIRPLSDVEIDHVDGAFLPALAVGLWLSAGFVWGMVAGDYLAEAYYGG
jgi:hypothetical protein